MGKGADISTADGIAISGSGGSVDVYAQKHITLKQRITVTAGETQLAHDVALTGSLAVGVDAKVAGKLDVGG